MQIKGDAGKVTPQIGGGIIDVRDAGTAGGAGAGGGHGGGLVQGCDDGSVNGYIAGYQGRYDLAMVIQQTQHSRSLRLHIQEAQALALNYMSDSRTGGSTTRLEVLADGRGISQFTAKAAWSRF